VISLPGLRLEDLDDARLPALRELARSSALALMNTTTAAGFRGGGAVSAVASAYLTVGSGVRASVPVLPTAGVSADALPRTVWAEIGSRNPGLDLAALPATRFRKNGVRVGLLAAGRGTDGLAPLLAVTAPGVPIVAGSAGSRWLRRDASAPYGVIADIVAIAAEARRVLPGVDLLWLAPGDLERAATYAPWCFPAAQAAHRRDALANTNLLLELLLGDEALAKCEVLLIAPSAVTSRFGLTPIAWRKPGQSAGLLASGATHTVGLIANTDLMPHLLASLLPSTNARSPLRFVRTDGAVASLQRLDREARRADAMRSGAIPFFKAWLLAGALLALLPLPAGVRTHNGWLLRAWPFVVPLVAILLGAAIGGRVWPWPALALGALLLAKARSDRREELAATGLAVVLLLDPFLGSVILRDSPWGYSFILGARYYGIGNEWMGYLVGAVLLSPPRARLSLLIAALIALAHPGWGADFGGALTAATALVALNWARGRGRARRVAIVGGVAAAAALLAVVALDARRGPESQTHLGRLVNEISVHGLAPLERIVRGKVATNVRIAVGYWGLLLACEAAVCLRGLRVHRNVVRLASEALELGEVAMSSGGRSSPRAQRRRRTISPGTGQDEAAGSAGASPSPDRRGPAPVAHNATDGVVLLIAAFAALLFNDSGVIAAALMLSLAPLLNAGRGEVETATTL
jgi:hypothetical protein